MFFSLTHAAKILLFTRPIYKPADNYKGEGDDNPESPSAQLQLHLLPAGKRLLYRVRHADAVRAAQVQGIMAKFVYEQILVLLYPYRIALITDVDAIQSIDAVT